VDSGVRGYGCAVTPRVSGRFRAVAELVGWMIPRIIHKRPLKQLPPCIPNTASHTARPHRSLPPAPATSASRLWVRDDVQPAPAVICSIDCTASACGPASVPGVTPILASEESPGDSPEGQPKHTMPSHLRCPRGPGWPARRGERMLLFLQPHKTRQEGQARRPPRRLVNTSQCSRRGRSCDGRALRPQRAGREGSAQARTSEATRARRAGRRAGRGTGHRKTSPGDVFCQGDVFNRFAHFALE
jgi:hypothetical protein